MYGGDGLDPTDMEGKDKPLDYNRVFSHVQVRVFYCRFGLIRLDRFFLYSRESKSFKFSSKVKSQYIKP